MMTAGCFSAFAADELVIFNREYYAVKDLNSTDIWKLKELLISADKGAAKNAGVILGRHYVRQGELDRGYKLLKENLDDSYFDRFMRINAHLWVYDAALKSKDDDIVKIEKEYLAKETLDDKADKAFRIYCFQEKLNIDSENVKACINRTVPDKKPESVFDLKPVVKAVPSVTAVAAVPVVVPSPSAPVVILPEAPKTAMAPRVAEEKPAVQPAEPAPTPEIIPEPVKEQPVKQPAGTRGKVVVNVLNSFQNPEIVEAMLYTISRQKVSVELDFKGDKSYYDYVIDAGSATITSNGTTYSFAAGRKENMKKACELAVTMGAKLIVLGYSEGFKDTAAEIADSFKGTAQFMLFNIQEKDFQGRMREFKNKAGGQPLSYVISGTQEQVLKVLPFLKYYSPRPDKTVIVNAVDTVSKKYLTGEYGEFAKNTYVVTDLVVSESAAAETFAADFTKDFNKAPVISDFIGHDFIQFIEKNRNPSAGNEYLSSIKEVQKGSVKREAGAYRIIGGGKLTKMEN